MSLYRLAYRSGILIGDIANMLWPITSASRVEPPPATLDDVCDRLDDIRNQLHGLSVPPAVSARVVSAGHPTSTDNPSPEGSVERPGGGDSTTPPGHPTLSELLLEAATWIRGSNEFDYNEVGTLVAELRDAAAQMAAVESEPL